MKKNLTLTVDGYQDFVKYWTTRKGRSSILIVLAIGPYLRKRKGVEHWRITKEVEDLLENMQAMGHWHLHSECTFLYISIAYLRKKRHGFYLLLGFLLGSHPKSPSYFMYQELNKPR